MPMTRPQRLVLFSHKTHDEVAVRSAKQYPPSEGHTPQLNCSMYRGVQLPPDLSPEASRWSYWLSLQ